MSTDDFQRLVLEQLTILNQSQKQVNDRLTTIEHNQAQVNDRLESIERNQSETNTKIDYILVEIKNLKESDVALLDLIEKTYVKTEQIETKLDHHAQMLDILAARTIHQEAEIKSLKIAK